MVFAVVTAVFGMNFETSIFDEPSLFDWVLIITGVLCLVIYILMLIYIKRKKILTL